MCYIFTHVKQTKGNLGEAMYIWLTIKIKFPSTSKEFFKMFSKHMLRMKNEHS